MKEPSPWKGFEAFGLTSLQGDGSILYPLPMLKGTAGQRYCFLVILMSVRATFHIRSLTITAGR